MEGSSRSTKHDAGWRGRLPSPLYTLWERLLEQRKRTRWGNFTWISPGPLLASINDQIVKGLDDLVNERRPRWVAAVRGGDWTDDALAVRRHEGLSDFSFLLLGDPGEQDASQYAVVAPLLSQAADTAFAIVASDVIYPSGDINDYLDGFYLPYRDFRQPIYGVPGNHDWYDGLNGFMFHFCGADALSDVRYRSGSYTWRERMARVLWRNPSPPKLAQLNHERSQRAQRGSGATDGEPWQPPQPGPYFTIDTRELRIVCIDTGITGVLDREQGEWLRRVSQDSRPKVLVTGKPIYVDGEYHPGDIAWGPVGDADIARGVGELRTVDDIVRHRGHKYLAAIGGDVHNFQHYPIDVYDAPEPAPDARGRREERAKRRIDCIVSGAGGAYLSATHRFGKVSLDPAADPRLPRNIEPLREDDVRLYPLRGDSLTRFVHRFVPMLGAAVLTAAVLVAAVLTVFFWPLDGFGEDIETLGKAWQVLAAGLGAVVAAGVVAWLAAKLSNGLAPPGYRALGATTFFVAVAAGIAFGLYQLGPDTWGWIWRSALSAAIAVVVPVALLLGYHLLEDFIPGSVRVGLALLPALALAVVAFVDVTPKLDGKAMLTVCGALLVLWLAVIAIGHLRHPGDTPGQANKTRLRIGRLLPLALGFSAVVFMLAGIDSDSASAWIPDGVLWMTAALLTLAGLLLLAAGFRALPALPWLFSPYADADEVARWLGTKLVSCPVRESARTASVSAKTKRLAALTYRSWPFTRIISELAEATRPPFFKSFLRLELKGETLTVTCFGVTGYLEDEQSPSIEHEIPIDVRRADVGLSAASRTVAGRS